MIVTISNHDCTFLPFIKCDLDLLTILYFSWRHLIYLSALDINDLASQWNEMKIDIKNSIISINLAHNFSLCRAWSLLNEVMLTSSAMPAEKVVKQLSIVSFCCLPKGVWDSSFALQMGIDWKDALAIRGSHFQIIFWSSSRICQWFQDFPKFV